MQAFKQAECSFRQFSASGSLHQKTEPHCEVSSVPLLECVVFFFYFSSFQVHIPSNSMATGFLKVKGDRIVDDNGHDIVLRGAGLGGWMKLVIIQTLFANVRN